MAGVKGKSGGVRPNSGRKSKADELELIERLSPMDDDALRELGKGVRSGDIQFIKLFFAYRFGDPKQNVTVKSNNTNITKIILEDVDGSEI